MLETETPVQQFYRGANVLITGGTGFLGKVLTEKILRSLRVENIYLIIRCKKGKSESDRLKELLADTVFERITKENQSVLEKIRLIPGDCSLPGLGIADTDRQILREKVNVVFHGAATVRFDENLKIATGINVGGTKEMLLLAHEIQNLKAFVHVSTAFSNCNRQVIDEKFYEPPSSCDRILEMANVLTTKELDILTPELLETWPNTYVLTKAMAESVVKREEGRIPACIFRPGVITTTHKEPISGWIDNMYGPTGITLAVGCGVVRVIHADSNNDTNIVPVDLAANGIIKAAEETSRNFRNYKSEIKIYNYISAPDNSITWGEYMNILQTVGQDVPSLQSIWYCSLVLVKTRPLYLIYAFLLHILPAFLIDTVAFLLGKNPQMIRSYQKIEKFASVLRFFANKRFTFTNENVRQLVSSSDPEDNKLFNCDVKTIDWKEYLTDYIRGVRVYVLKESWDTLPAALTKWRRLYWQHQILKFFIWCFILKIFYAIITHIF